MGYIASEYTKTAKEEPKTAGIEKRPRPDTIIAGSKARNHTMSRQRHMYRMGRSNKERNGGYY